jgi:hypothetical protein
VIDGYEVVETIEGLETRRGDRPVEDAVIAGAGVLEE